MTEGPLRGEAFLASLKGASVTVIGLARETTAVVRLLHAAGAHVRVEPVFTTADLTGEQLIVITAAASLDSSALTAARAAGVTVLGDLDLGWCATEADAIAVAGGPVARAAVRFARAVLARPGGRSSRPAEASRSWWRARPDSAATGSCSSSRRPAQLATAQLFRPRVAAVVGGIGGHLSSIEWLFARQTPNDCVVLDADNADTRTLARHARSRVLWCSATGAVDHGVYVARDRITARFADHVEDICPVEGVPRHLMPAALAAVACALWAGMAPDTIGAALIPGGSERSSAPRPRDRPRSPRRSTCGRPAAFTSRSGAPDASENPAGLLALRDRPRAGVHGRGDDLFRERHRGRGPLPRSVLLPQAPGILGGPRLRRALDRAAQRRSPPREVRAAAAGPLRTAAGPRAHSRPRGLDQRLAPLAPTRSALVPAGGGAAKLALVVYLAVFLARKREELDDFWHGVVPPLAVGGTLAALVLLQPDLGSAITLLVLTIGLLFLAGARASWLAMLAVPALPLAALAVWIAPYRMRRVFAFLDPWQDPRGSGFQIIQSWLAFGSGGTLGRGIGESRQKLFYLPEAHTDFIFAIVGEELGFIGASAVVLLFVALIWRGLRIGLRAADPFGAYLALGITVLVATQTLVNLGVVTGLLPTKGLPLPYLSFGGSALLVTMLGTGVLLNISQDARV